MGLNEIEKAIEGKAKIESHTRYDAEKSFFSKSLRSEEQPTPVMQGLIPKSDIAVERKSTTDLHLPGEFCYRDMAIATGSGDKPKTIYVKRVMMNCPFCNKPQFLYNNEKVYDGAPDPRKPWQKWLNNFLEKIGYFKDKYVWTEQLTGTLTVKGPITCHFNNLHRWTVVKNKISFYFPKTLVK